MSSVEKMDKIEQLEYIQRFNVYENLIKKKEGQVMILKNAYDYHTSCINKIDKVIANSEGNSSSTVAFAWIERLIAIVERTFPDLTKIEGLIVEKFFRMLIVFSLIISYFSEN